MVKSSYRTDIVVKDIAKAIDFFQLKLGLQLCCHEKEKKLATFWIGREGFSILYLLEEGSDEATIRDNNHINTVYFMHESISYLKKKQLKLWNFLMDSSQNPVVFAEIPALVINFYDSEDQTLTFVGMLQDKPRPELGIVPFMEWKND